MAQRLALLLGIALLVAQPVDPAKYRVDPSTFLFEDGRTTLTDYVLAQLQAHSTCCGQDGIYVELRITPEGTLEGVRPMTGRNDCYKKSVQDILRPLRWKAEGFQTTRTVYYEFRLARECQGSAEDNVYKPIPAPGGLAAGATPAEPAKEVAKAEPAKPEPAKAEPKAPEAPKAVTPPAAVEEPTPIPPTPSIPQTKESGTSRLSSESPKAQPKSEPAPTPSSEPAPSAPKKKPAQPKPTPSQPSDVPARKGGFQPGTPPPDKPGDPRPPAIVGSLPTDSVPQTLAVAIPKKYTSTGEKRPPEAHVTSYANTAGPRYMEPDYISGPIAKALYLKKTYRELGACGLVHVLLEIAIDQNGQIRGYRILNANSKLVADVTPRVLQGMRYKPVPLPMVFYAEFKIDVDCESDHRKQNLDSIPDYLVTPDPKLIRPATTKP